ncbi:hypothetical protein [Undibacterium sp. Xuan67W]|uniref:hypothetical protein n=1 Tax=Undibacterium sp. Xuan67W TaxID=3413057 RepID=UPI003BF1CBB4
MNENTTNEYVTAHEITQELLPWFVAQTLVDEEMDFVKKHVQSCNHCMNDVNFLLKLQTSEALAPTSADIERAFARVLPRLGSNSQINIKRNNIFNKLTTFFSHIGASVNTKMSWALAIQAVVIAGLLTHLGLQEEKYSGYRLQGATGKSSGNVVVVFKPETTVKEVQRIMSINDARIIDGPTVTNAYVLNVPEEKLISSVKELRAEPAIELVESLYYQGEAQ